LARVFSVQEVLSLSALYYRVPVCVCVGRLRIKVEDQRAGGTELASLGKAESVPRGKGEVAEGKCHHHRREAAFPGNRQRPGLASLPGICFSDLVPCDPVCPSLVAGSSQGSAGTAKPELYLTTVKRRTTCPRAWQLTERLVGRVLTVLHVNCGGVCRALVLTSSRVGVACRDL
jgi:hypothetical protein